MTQGSAKYYLHYDQVGSLRAVSDTSHNIIKEVTYDTFGNILHDTNQNFKIPFGFAGGLYDTDTKLTRFGYRDYDAYTGKWTAKDPIDFSGGDSNLYGYVLGDPVNFIDPEGLYVWYLMEPTTMGPNSMITIDKNGNKSIYDFDSGKTKPYWNNKKTYCETGKDDGSDRLRNQDLIDANPNNKPPAGRPKGNKWWNVLEALDKMGIL